METRKNVLNILMVSKGLKYGLKKKKKAANNLSFTSNIFSHFWVTFGSHKVFVASENRCSYSTKVDEEIKDWRIKSWEMTASES